MATSTPPPHSVSNSLITAMRVVLPLVPRSEHSPSPSTAAIDAIVKSCEDYLMDNEKQINGRRRGSLTSAGKEMGGVKSVPKGYETIWGASSVPSASDKV